MYMYVHSENTVLVLGRCAVKGSPMFNIRTTISYKQPCTRMYSKFEGKRIHQDVRYAISRRHTTTHCNTLQHTAAHCTTLQYTAAQWKKLTRDAVGERHTATRWNTLQHDVTHCNAPQNTATEQWKSVRIIGWQATHCNKLYYTVIHCDSLQHTAPRCITPQHAATHYNALQDTATHIRCEFAIPIEEFCVDDNSYWSTQHDSLQHTATQNNTLQHTATHCNTLQHTSDASSWSL